MVPSDFVESSTDTSHLAAGRGPAAQDHVEQSTTVGEADYVDPSTSTARMVAGGGRRTADAFGAACCPTVDWLAWLAAGAGCWSRESIAPSSADGGAGRGFSTQAAQATGADAIQLRPETEELFSQLVRFIRIRMQADAIWSEELVELEGDIRDKRLSVRSTLARTTQRLFGVQSLECDHVLPYRAEVQQQNVHGDVARDFDELQEAARLAMPRFVEFLADALANVDGIDFEAHRASWVAPLKGLDRMQSKAKSKYVVREPGPPMSWIYDVVRGHVECESILQLFMVTQQLSKAVEKRAAECGCGRLLRLKNRCLKPPLSGCRDMFINIQLPVPKPRPATADEAKDGDTEAGAGAYFLHVCEIQIHHARMKQHDIQSNSHRVYEFFRDFFHGGERDTVEQHMEVLKDFVGMLDMLQERGAVAEGRQLGPLVAWMREHETDVPKLFTLEHVLRQQMSEFVAASLVTDRVLTLQATWAERSRALDRKARNRRNRGDFEDALSFELEALEIAKRIHGSRHPKVAARLNNLARVKQAAGDLAGAFALYSEALRITKAAHGEMHPDVAATLNNMGLIRRLQGDVDGALQLYEEALRIKVATVGPTHPDVATTLNNVALVKRAKGELTTALGILEDAVRIQKAAYGEKHPDVAATLTNIGRIALEVGNIGLAQACLRESYQQRRELLGDKHPRTKKTLRALRKALNTAKPRLAYSTSVQERLDLQALD